MRRLALLLASTFAIPAVAQTPRIHTDRPTGAQLLKLPKEEDAFGFVVFGDRTGGRPEGIEVLKQAVTDTNLLDPDLVLTVGDLVEGYNGKDAWHAQAKEFKAAMDRLRMPWFPVAGNHDIYWRGPGKPPGEHEADFEATFGPLWYAVQHKQCWFVVLYSDEGDPKTGEKNFNKPECQSISDAQFTWLQQTLAQAKAARHVFVFLHHPRWLSQYGDDWQRVHTALAQAGNVRAVFAGHIHRIRHDGVRDGIEYHTVASVGAHLALEAPRAGYLHEFHVVSVRPQGITVAAVPVGAVLDPRQISGELSDDVDRVHHRLRIEAERCDPAGTEPAIAVDGAVDAIVTLRADNPGKRPLALELTPSGFGYLFAPDHQHLLVAPGQSASTTFAVRRAASAVDPFALPSLLVQVDYLAPDARITLPSRTLDFPLPPPAGLGERRADHEGVLVLDGQTACATVSSPQLTVPDGPFTVEAWLRAEDVRGRRGIVSKAQSSEFGLLAVDGALEFVVFLGDRYAIAKSAAPVLVPGTWQHVAGVFDGSTVRCFVDGRPVAEGKGSGARKTNTLPLFVGADTDGSGRPTAFCAACLDEVRISVGARYGAAFTPASRHDRDADTLLLLPCDGDFGPWLPDASGQARHARRLGTAHCTLEARPGPR